MLSPWDAYRWFDTPVETVWSFTLAGPTVEVAKHNVRRVVLMFSLPTTTSARVSIVQGTGSTGVLLVSGQAPLILTQQQHGPLCQVSWFAGGLGSGILTVTEVFLRDWPHTEEGPPDGA